MGALLKVESPRLRHLEITIVLVPRYPVDMHIDNLRGLFEQWVNLEVLSLRLRDSAGRDRVAISKALEEGIQGFPKLRSLSIGGCGLLAGGCSAAAFRKMPLLESLTLFPVLERRDDLPEGALFDPINGDRGLVQCLRTKGAFPRLRELEVQRGAGQGPSAALRRACEKRGVKLRMPVVGVREWLYVPEEGEDV